MTKPKASDADTKPVALSTLLKDFVTDVWDLDHEGKFPKEANMASRVVFTANSISVDSMALKDLEITVCDDRIEVPWMDPPVKMMAADPYIFEMTIALIAHLMMVCSMGWDTTTKTGEYTKKRVAEIVDERRRNPGKLSKKKVQRES